MSGKIASVLFCIIAIIHRFRRYFVISTNIYIEYLTAKPTTFSARCLPSNAFHLIRSFVPSVNRFHKFIDFFFFTSIPTERCKYGLDSSYIFLHNMNYVLYILKPNHAIFHSHSKVKLWKQHFYLKFIINEIYFIFPMVKISQCLFFFLFKTGDDQSTLTTLYCTVSHKGITIVKKQQKWNAEAFLQFIIFEENKQLN